MAIDLKYLIDEYKRLVNLNDIIITLNNGDKIQFKFKIENLPHILGFQHVKDIPLFYKYGERQIYARELLNKIESGYISQSELDSSESFKKIYDTRIQYFNYEYIYNLILNGTISGFNPIKVRQFDTKLDKIDYMIWDNVSDGNNHLGIGFSKTDNLGHPNTFFYRNNNDYTENQIVYNKLTLNIKNTEHINKHLFKIYWENVHNSLEGTVHYKKLEKHADIIGCDIKNLTEDIVYSLNPQTCDKEFITREFNLLQIDKIQKIYDTYFLENNPHFKWNNKEKLFIIKSIEHKKEDLLPHEVSVLLNDFRQKN